MEGRRRAMGRFETSLCIISSATDFVNAYVLGHSPKSLKEDLKLRISTTTLLYK